MSFFYEENALPFTGNPTPYDKMNANKRFLTHYGNSLFLAFMAGNPLATQKEKADARREIPIAARKMQYFEKHPNFEKAIVQRESEKLKKEWEGKR